MNARVLAVVLLLLLHWPRSLLIELAQVVLPVYPTYSSIYSPLLCVTVEVAQTHNYLDVFPAFLHGDRTALHVRVVRVCV